jgi:hypothetical protein
VQKVQNTGANVPYLAGANVVRRKAIFPTEDNLSKRRQFFRQKATFPTEDNLSDRRQHLQWKMTFHREDDLSKLFLICPNKPVNEAKCVSAMQDFLFI